MVEASFERSARFWLRAYPRRWRAVHAEEVVGVLADLAGPDARRVDARGAAGLVRGGWATRWRGHPGPLTWLGYRLFDAPIPPRFRAWAADDISGAGYILKRNAISFPIWGMLLAGNGFPSVRASWWGWMAVIAAILALELTVGAGYLRRKARERHLVAEPGEPLLPGTWVAMGAPTRRVPAAWAVNRMLGVLGVFVVLGVTASALAPVALLQRPVHGQSGAWEIVDGPIGALRWVVLGVLAAALVVGLVLAVRAARLLADRLTALPPQPDREVRPPSGWVDAGLVGLVAVAVLAAWAEATGAMAVWVSPFLAALALVVLPRTIVLRRAGARVGWRGPDGAALAWSDLTWLGRFAARPVPVDPGRRVVRRWDGPSVPGQVVLGPVGAPDPPWPPVSA